MRVRNDFWPIEPNEMHSYWNLKGITNFSIRSINHKYDFAWKAILNFWFKTPFKIWFLIWSSKFISIQLPPSKVPSWVKSDHFSSCLLKTLWMTNKLTKPGWMWSIFWCGWEIASSGWVETFTLAKQVINVSFVFASEETKQICRPASRPYPELECYRLVLTTTKS